MSIFGVMNSFLISLYWQSWMIGLSAMSLPSGFRNPKLVQRYKRLFTYGSVTLKTLHEG